MPDKNPECPTVAIVGATGLVGSEALQILESRNHPADRIRCYGSERSSGSSLNYGHGSGQSTLPIHPLRLICEHEHDYALLCVDADTARAVRTVLEPTETIIIDNSSAFRMDPDVPLVIPEVNGDLLGDRPRIVANPNCSTIMLLVALQPIRESIGISSITVTTYQAVSGAGKAGLSELYTQTRSYLDNEYAAPSVFPRSCAFNVFEHESRIDPVTGFNGEETKMILESKRIWDDPTLKILPTCVRVPVERAHAQSVVVELDTPSDVQTIRNLLAQPGIQRQDDGLTLTPRDASGRNGVFVGRIRIDPSSDGRRAILWICCDQIRKGAALNAIQIMDAIQNASRTLRAATRSVAQSQR